MTMALLKVAFLFAVTAVAEIVGCYLPWLVVKQDKSAWLLVPAAFSLALFAWLLTVHPAAAGRTYAAYGGMYIAVALVWLHVVERDRVDPLGPRRRSHRSGRHGGHRIATVRSKGCRENAV
jgi:small multidrug resistance family-3 protein